MQKILAAVSFLCVSAAAQPKFEFWPGAQYNAAIPTVQKTLGFDAGDRLPTHAEIVKYFEALAAAAPSRMRIVEYGKTWEGRKLIYAVIASEENLRRLDEIKAGQKRLADPRKTPAADAKKLIASAPTVLALIYGVHGNEISSPDAAMMTAYHLLAARGDQMVDSVFKNVVVLIDPLQNPDGRDRFVQNFRASEGLEPNPFPPAAERAEPWPGGRSNHYLFDMNRDWFAMTQPETRGRVKYLLEWMPQVVVDLHEMGTDSTYFFAPGANPHNPHLTSDQKQEMEWFGKNNAKWFDKFGYAYFTREVFDEFYPGYGAAWPWYYGGMGMTYENASVRGLVVRRSDETIYTFKDSVRRHFVASVATCEAAVANREKLLDNFYRYQASAIEEGQKEPVKEYILPRRGDVSAVDKLAHLLAEHGVEVRRATAAFKNAGKDYPAGSYAISLAQPRKRFVRTVMDPNTPMDAEFVKEQERRRKKNLRDEIYDVTGWSLPLLYNVESVQAAEVSQGSFEPVSGPYQPKGAVSGKAQVAYVIPWGTQAAGRFLAAAFRADLRVLSANKSFTLAGRKYPSGTLIVMVQQNKADVHEKVAQSAATSGAEVIATDTSWVEDGINFGSNNVAVLKKPAVLLVWDTPASSASAGQTRFVLERQYGYPVTVVRPGALAAADLTKIQVIILPDSGMGGYAGAISPAVSERLRAWVRSGGVLIGVGGAVNYLASQQMGLLALQQENLAKADAKPEAKPAEAAKPAGPGAPAATPAGPVAGKILAKPEDYEKAIQADTELPPAVAGVLARAKVDTEHWLGAGVAETINVLVDGRAIYAPLKRDKGVNVAAYAGPDELLASGYLWEENRKQLAYKPFAAVQNEGRGVVIGFTSDPSFRAYMDGLNVIFLNAVFRGPAAAGRGGPGEE